MIFRDEIRRHPLQPDLTPLINIVFLMLVFFMLAGSIVPADGIEPASIESARVDAQGAVQDGLLIVSVNREGIASINNVEFTDDALLHRLTAHAQQDGHVGVRPDARLHAQRLVQLSGLFRRAGFDAMTMITHRR